jgi:hypothetical protein
LSCWAYHQEEEEEEEEHSQTATTDSQPLSHSATSRKWQKGKVTGHVANLFTNIYIYIYTTHQSVQAITIFFTVCPSLSFSLSKLQVSRKLKNSEVRIQKPN